METLIVEEVDIILESLRYTCKAFEEYTGYPSYEFKLNQIAAVTAIIDKLRGMKRALREVKHGV
jgi:hypothetical protein